MHRCLGPTDAALKAAELEQQIQTLLVGWRFVQRTSQEMYRWGWSPALDRLPGGLGERLNYPTTSRTGFRREKMHRDFRNRSVARRQHLGGLTMQTEPLTRREGSMNGVANYRVLEPQRTRVLEHPLCCQRGSSRGTCRLIETGERRRECELRVVSKNGCRPDELFRVGAKSRNSPVHGRRNRFRPNRFHEIDT
jgi:hypothetical protein